MMDISNYFESEDFVVALQPLNTKVNKNFEQMKSLINDVISETLQYYNYFSNEENISKDNLNNFVKNITTKIASIPYDLNNICDQIEDYIANLYVDEILKKLNVSTEDLNNENVKEMVYKYIITKFMNKEYKFHAFNSVFYDSIKEHGINPNIMYASQNDLNKIDAIFQKYEIEYITGWQKLNCTGQVHYSTQPNQSYSYAVSSPEWFSEFCGDGSTFYQEKYRKNTFVSNDYHGAKNNLLMLMNEYNFTNYDVNEVMNFFENNWNIYANKDNNPMIAMISEKISYEQYEEMLNFRLKFLIERNFTLENTINACKKVDYYDEVSTEPIDVSNAIFIKLPKLEYLIDRLITFNNKNNDKNSKDYEVTINKDIQLLKQLKNEVEDINKTNDEINFKCDDEPESLKIY